MDSPARFDAHYYERFYRNPATRASTPQSARRQAAFVAAYLRHLDLPVRRILDIGCGLGWMLRGLQDEFPRARVTGVEYSEHLCKKKGWKRGSVTTFSDRVPYDLVICQDVLPALNDSNASRAIVNLGRLCRGALFVGALTAEDWERCDRSRTDPDVFLRSAQWYRRRLAKEFETIGGGIFLKRPLAVPLWSLETVPASNKRKSALAD